MRRVVGLGLRRVLRDNDKKYNNYNIIIIITSMSSSAI